MATSLSFNTVYRKEVVANDTTPDQVFAFPGNLRDITVRLVGNAAASARLRESFSTEEQIRTGTGVTWDSVDASLDSVGATAVKYVFTKTPCALQVSRLSATQIATLVITGRMVRE